jgi:hypothetical protein
VRLRITDDLVRNRLTVFFRVLLAIPHYVWIFLWSIAAFFAAIGMWFATLAAGRPPEALHRFLSAYIRYATHVNSYLWLLANPYPGFTGEAGSFPIDVELPPPALQARWTVLLRIFLVLPAIFLSAFLGGGLIGPSSIGGKRYGTGTGGGFLLLVVGMLGWFASLARGRMPRGLRDAGAYSVGYGAQVLAYLLVLTDRYPNADPAPLLADLRPPPAHPVRLELAADDLRRSRVTVFFRLLLAVPHIVWLVLWSIAAVLASIVNWFVALATGAPAESLHRFLSAYVRYSTHVNAFVYLVGNPFPGFVGARGSYPVDLELPPATQQSRWITGFRVFLIIPAWLVNSALGYALFASAVLSWFASLALGRAPEGLRNLGAYALRYSAQVNAYGYLVTDRYPHASPLQGEPDDEAEPAVLQSAAA